MPVVLMRTRRPNSYASAPFWFLFLSLTFPAYAQTGTPPSNRVGTPEQRATRAFEKVRANPLALRAFLARDADQQRNEAVIAVAMNRRRQAHRGRTHAT